jgi:dihydroorotase
MERTWCKPLPAAELLIKGGRVVDPETGVDAVQDVLVKKGKVAEVGRDLKGGKNTRVVDAEGMLVLPGFVDLHAHFRTPGREDEEDIATASSAAAAGGYVAAFGMANTDPVVDNAAVFKGLVQLAGRDAVVPVGFFASVTKGLAGEELSEMGELGAAGAVGFSDDGLPLPNAAITRRALQYVKVSKRFVAIHAQDASLFKGGQMHEGPASARLGLTGIPDLCESLDVSRTLDIAAYEDADLHVCHVSTEKSLAAIARAREAGVRVTAEVTPHHLTLNDELDPNLKMNPPLRAESDRKALVEALRSGLVDCVATDHAPHAIEEKDVPYEEAVFGCIGLETAFSVLHTQLVESGELDLTTLVTRMSGAPARIAGLDAPSIAAGAVADLCVVDPAAEWTVTPDALQSRSWNSPWLGQELTGKVRLTVAAGRVAWDDLA